MKKLLVFLFVLIAIFAFASCNNDPQNAEPTPTPAPEPEPAPEPAPEPGPEPEPAAPATYLLTATATGDRFQFKWDDLAVKAGDVITFKYQSEKTMTSHTTRTIDPSTKLVDGEALTGEPTDGWYTFSFTIPEGKSGTGLGIALFVDGGAAVGDKLKIKDIALNETTLTLAQANSWAGCSPTIEVYEPELDYYRLTATREATRFALKYIGGEGEGAINPKAGDVLTLKYRTNHAVTHIYLHDYAYEKQLEKKASIAPYISEADEDGWITFTFTYPEKESFYDEVSGTISGIYLQLTNYLDGAHEDGMGKFAVDDYLEIKDFKFNGTALTIDPAGDDGKSDHGVWNQAIDDTNTDHTIPTLEEIYL